MMIRRCLVSIVPMPPVLCFRWRMVSTNRGPFVGPDRTATRTVIINRANPRVMVVMDGRNGLVPMMMHSNSNIQLASVA